MRDLCDKVFSTGKENPATVICKARLEYRGYIILLNEEILRGVAPASVSYHCRIMGPASARLKDTPGFADSGKAIDAAKEVIDRRLRQDNTQRELTL